MPRSSAIFSASLLFWALYHQGNFWVNGQLSAQGMALMAKEGTVKAYFRGNGANVMKNIPETVSSFLTGHHTTKRFLASALMGALLRHLPASCA